MKRRVSEAVASVVVLMLLALNTALADDYVADAMRSLQYAPVYVAPGTEGTDHDTDAKLQSLLKEDDGIVLVMFPASASTEEAGVDTFTMASRLSKELGDQKIIGLAIGKDVIGYAPVLLPAGVAADLMRRAQSVSNDPVTALITFTQNVHFWRREHPRQTPAPTATSTSTPIPTPTPAPTLSPEELQHAAEIRNAWTGGIFVLVFAVIIIVGVAKIAFNMAKRRKD